MSFTPFLLFECMSYFLAAVIKKPQPKAALWRKAPLYYMLPQGIQSITVRKSQQWVCEPGLPVGKQRDCISSAHRKEREEGL